MTTKVETGTARKEWACNFSDCSKKITKGQEYFLWHLNGDALRQHQTHGEPALKEATKKATTKTKVTKDQEESHNQESHKESQQKGEGR